MRNTGRTTYNIASREYDPTFERTVTAELIETITRISIVTDAPVMVLRTAETASALLSVLALILAMSLHDARSPAAIQRTTDDLARRLRRRAADAEANENLRTVRRRSFHGNEGGHA